MANIECWVKVENLIDEVVVNLVRIKMKMLDMEKLCKNRRPIHLSE